ncbi:MAG: hypothetical protein AAF682_02315 [Planctomycetota bacterium]
MENAHDESRSSEMALLRHIVATVAYRAEKVLRDPPPGFAEHRISERSRTALEIVGHLGDLADWASDSAAGEGRWTAGSAGDWEADATRFFDGLARLDAHLAGGGELRCPPAALLQSALADALTHVGQIALLRGAFGAPVRPESYIHAEVTPGRVGADQSSERREFDGDASVRRG